MPAAHPYSIFALDSASQLDRYSRHNIEVVVDRLILRKREDRRLAEAVDNALRLGQGIFIVAREGASDFLLSNRFDCMAFGISYQEPTLYRILQRAPNRPLIESFSQLLLSDKQLILLNYRAVIIRRRKGSLK